MSDLLCPDAQLTVLKSEWRVLLRFWRYAAWKSLSGIGSGANS